MAESSQLPLANKVALITGATRGIGLAITRHLSSLGAKVVINYASSSASAKNLVSEIGHENALAVQADVSDVEALEKMVQQVVQQWRKIDILVLNAGVLPMMDLASTDEKTFDRTMAVNVKGPYFLAQKAAPHMPPSSSIIFFSTTLCAASTVQPAYLLYNATKGAIEQMTRVMSKDLGRKGIRVNCIAPGPTGTELFYEGKSEQMLKTIAGFNPMNRIGEPEEIAEVVGLLARGEARWVAGQVLRVNGGMA
ncbi:hypothetical protein MMC18_007896 [Xylographa bjoerkii]|nr:hypothetical protein [Xylographa bjoerkii]